jgi:hypothetical protein
MHNKTAQVLARVATLLMLAIAVAEPGLAFGRPPIATSSTRRFDGATVAEVVRTFNRRNTVQLVVTDPAMGRQRIGGTFDLDRPEEFAAALQRLLGAKVVRDGDTIRLGARDVRW